MIPGSSKGPVPPTLAALVFATALAWSAPVTAESSVEPAEAAAAVPATETPAEVLAVPQAEPPPPARTPLNIHAYWDDRLVVESEGKNFFLQPIAILQTLFTGSYNSAGNHAATSSTSELDPPMGRSYEGLGFTFRRAALGFDSRFLGFVRTFFLANIASGTMNLWDYFADLDFFDGKAVLRAGRFRPWLGRQRLLAGDRYQMIQLPSAMTDILDFGDGRDLGAGIFGLLARKTIEYQVGVWNGEKSYAVDQVNTYLPGTSDFNRGNIDFEFGSRLVIHPLGYLPAFDESDLDYSEKPRLSVGAAAMFAKRHDVRVPSQDFVYFDDRLLKAGAEIAFRWRGFSFEAEAFFRKSWLQPNPKDESQRQFETLGIGSLAKGGYAQSGMFVKPKLLELTARFDYSDNEPKKPGYLLRPAAGANLFLHGYNLLIQVMYRANLVRGGLKDIKDIAGTLRPSERTDLVSGYRPISRTTHDLFLMLQTSL
jgi:hypothetical protein